MTPSDFDTQLRQPHPDEAPRLGLDTRIIARLPATRAKRFSLQHGLVAALLTLLATIPLAYWAFQPEHTPEQAAAVEAKLTLPSFTPTLRNFDDPLEREALALHKTAKRTSDFLMAQFSGLPTPTFPED